MSSSMLGLEDRANMKARGSAQYWTTALRARCLIAVSLAVRANRRRMQQRSYPHQLVTRAARRGNELWYVNSMAAIMREIRQFREAT